MSNRQTLVGRRLKPMKIEWEVFHRRDAEHAEMIRPFSLPLTPQDRLRYLRDGGRRQRKIVRPSGQSLITSKNLREALALPLFCCPCPVECEAHSTGISRKGKKHLSLCVLCASIPRRYLRGRAVQYRLVHAMKNPGPDPWPRPGMQGLSSMNYTTSVLQLPYNATAKSRQGRLACKD